MTHSEEELTQRMKRFFITVRDTIKYQPGPYMFIGKYDPKSISPGYLFVLDSLTRHQHLLVQIHELTHASMHRPGSGDYNEADYLKEEPCSNEAARLVCLEYGIADYLPAMQEVTGVTEYYGKGDDEVVGVMFDRVKSALESPNTIPDWAFPAF